MMQASKKIPLDNPDVLNIVRAVYIASNVIIAAVYLYIQVQVNKKKGMCSLDFR
jgi:hypothetical protein